MNTQTSATKTNSQSAPEQIDVLALVGMLIDYRWLIISLTGLFFLAGVAYALLATPIYQANTLLQIEERKSGLAGLEIMDDMFAGKSQTSAEIEIIKSRMIIGKAVENLQLDVSAKAKTFPLIGNYFARRFQASEEQPFAKPLFGLNQYNWGGASIKLHTLQLPNSLMDENLELVIKADDHFDLKHNGQTLLSNKQVGEDIEESGISLAVTELTGQVGQVFTLSRKNNLATIRSYQMGLQANEKGKQSGILTLTYQDPNPEKARLVLQEIANLYLRQNIERSAAEASNSLEFLRKQLPSIRLDMEQAEEKLNAYQIDAKSANITIETQAILNQLVQAEAELSELRLKQFELDKLFTSEHPSYQTLSNQIRTLEQNKHELEKRVSSLPKTQQELLRLNRDVKVSSELYTLLLQKAQELDIARASTVGNVRIIDTAVTDSRPVAPKKQLIVLIATLLGGMLSVGLALVHNLFNRGVESIEEIESTGLSVYASIPFSRNQIDSRGKNARSANTLPLLSIEHPEDLALEAFRSLHTSLHFTIPEAKNNIIMISGPTPMIGKSFVSSNLASVLAQAGVRVLLIDADMRKGHLHYYFGNNNQRGLSSLLSAQASLDECIQTTQIENLDFISRGKNPPNPTELLLSEKFNQSLDELSPLYDLILIDTPPVLAVADAIIVGKKAGSNFLVTRFGQNPIGEIRAALKRFEENDVTIKGAIFNAVKAKASNYYKYGYYSYQYSYKADKE